MTQVNVSEGTLEGELLISELGFEYYSFKGIPYAEPPIGELRFKAPQPLKPWEGVRSAKEHGPHCVQTDIITMTYMGGSEDCLYLNMYTKTIIPENPLPVMVLIHGGGFWCGSGNSDHYGPDFLVDKDVILVTINYRLGPLGFLCLDTEDIPGNAGMKDQVSALRWVKRNIENFGGNPDNVTIFGESAGGASVSFHLISPMSKGLFKRAIVQSGVASCYWANGFEPRERAIALARELGKHTSDDKELCEFFRSQPAKELLSKKPQVTIAETERCNLAILFNIVSEKQFGKNERFFYGDVNEALQNGIHDDVEVIFGYTGDEGILGFIQRPLDGIIEKANNFLETFVPRPIALTLSIKKQLEVGRKIRKFYYGNEAITKENLDPLIQFFAMEMFAYDILQWVKECSIKNHNIYLYKFNYWSERNNFQSILAPKEVTNGRKIACHGEDIMYLFNTKYSKLDLNANSYKMVENMTTLWTNFAKNGNPTPDESLGVKWSPYTLKTREYLDIDDEMSLKSSPEQSELEFWEGIINGYFP